MGSARTATADPAPNGQHSSHVTTVDVHNATEAGAGNPSVHNSVMSFPVSRRGLCSPPIQRRHEDLSANKPPHGGARSRQAPPYYYVTGQPSDDREDAQKCEYYLLYCN